MGGIGGLSGRFVVPDRKEFPHEEAAEDGRLHMIGPAEERLYQGREKGVAAGGGERLAVTGMQRTSRVQRGDKHADGASASFPFPRC
mmetsp:Transcript_6771/g.16303  ORF Transcript_6771/g.16303 Transcript_6771/m.16303 type:complete len:87 (+) Transcript_6771:486-746(+)